MSDGTTRHFADEAAAAGKSATVADLVLVERVVEGHRLILRQGSTGQIFAFIDGFTTAIDLSDSSAYSKSVELLIDCVSGTRPLFSATFHEMRFIAMNQLALRQQPEGKNENASYLPEPDAGAEEAPDRALLADLMVLPASQLVEVFAEICVTAGIPPHQRAAFSSALMQRLTPDKPLSAREVLAKTLFRQRGKGDA